MRAGLYIGLLLLLANTAPLGAQATDAAPFRPVIRLKGTAAASPATDTSSAAVTAKKPPQPATDSVKARKPARPVARTAAPAAQPARATAAAAVAEPVVSPVPPAAEAPAADTAIAAEPVAVAADTAAADTVATTPAVSEPAPAPVVAAPAAKPAPASSAALPSFVIKGFVGATVFAQDRALGFGNGQSALWAKSQEVKEDAGLIGADIRNTRLSLGFSGGEIAPGMRASGVLEFDFFGGFAGASPSADEQPLPRLRLAYADLVRGSTLLRIGQFWSPLAGNIPVSQSHVAFPLGLGSGGLIGWRNPGLLVQHGFGAGARRKAAVQAAVFRGSWTGADVLDQQSAGETSALPQVELRFDLSSGTRWSAYVVGHVDGKDLNGVGPDTAGLGTLYGHAVAAGAKLVAGRLTLHGNGYRGRAIAQQMGQLAQYGDIGSYGGWVQAGYTVSGPWSAWAYLGIDDTRDEDVFRAVKGDGRLKNRLLALQLQYARGDYSTGLEIIRPTTTWGRLVDGAPSRWERSGAQLAFSVVYRFSSDAPTAIAAR